MSLLVTGSLGIDNVTTPHGTVTNVIGGSAIYFSWAAAAFSKVRLVAVVGEDFPPEFESAFAHPNIDASGLERRKGSKTFRWTGSYDPTMNDATTVEIDLNVLIERGPTVPPAFTDSQTVFLAATHPALQLDLLSQIKAPQLAVADTRGVPWITEFRGELLGALKQMDGLVLNDHEARQLTQKVSLVECLPLIQAWLKPTGPKILIIKKGEHGCLAACGNDIFALPAYPTGKVIDPTGAGDSFAGGLLGYLANEIAASKPVTTQTLKSAIAAGTVMASFTIEDFSLNRIRNVKPGEITERLTAYKQMLTV